MLPDRELIFRNIQRSKLRTILSIGALLLGVEMFVLERTCEIGMSQTIGFTRHQGLQMILAEAGQIG